jgi:hypothetical protein
MAVRVMVASALVRDAVAKPVSVQKATPAGQAARPKRRRSSIYDADGNEVFITLMCLKCHQMRPLAQFGLRKMADGAIRNQPWCRPCRSAAGAGKGKPMEASDSAESIENVPPVESIQVVAPVAAEPATPRPRDGQLSAQIAAALAAGLGR